MDLIKELKPFDAALQMFETRGALPQADVKDALVRIYEDLHKIKANIGPAKIKKGCAPCIKDMMKALVNNRREWINRPLIPFKGITETSKANVNIKKVEVNEAPEQAEMVKLNLDKMKFPALKIACARYRLPFNNKTTKLELVELLKNHIEKNK
jgi:hypothetical protein